MTHLASAEDPTQREFTHQQLQAFAPLAQAIKARYPAALAHASNSAGALAFAPQAFDMVRLGIGLYGLATGSPPANRLREVCTLATRVVQVRQRPAGTPIGYGCSQVLQRPTPVATLGIGYADGVPRALSNGVGYVLLHGKPCPILGRVCMDMLMVDATNAPNVKPGDEAVVFGTQAGVQLSLRQVAQAAGTIPYEILTHLSPRLRRVYVRE
jgi:alanine racemase